MFSITLCCSRSIPCRGRALGQAALLLSASLTVSGCATAFIRTAGAKAGLCGQEVADAALSAYSDLRAVAGDNTYFQGYLRVVVSPEPDGVDFTRVSDAGMPGLLEQRVRAYRQFRNAYALFQQLCSDDSSQNASQSYASLFETLKALSKEESVSAESKKTVAGLPGDFATLWQAKRIARVQSALGKLASELGALWDKEIPVWDAYIDAVYIDHYASGLLSLRLANFDEKELVKAVSDPYSVPVKAGLYKLQKYREACQKAARLKDELRLVSKAFQQLESLHRQLSGPAAGLADLLDAQNKIGHYAALAEKAGKE